jgi:hypothetical protein
MTEATHMTEDATGRAKLPLSHLSCGSTGISLSRAEFYFLSSLLLEFVRFAFHIERIERG